MHLEGEEAIKRLQELVDHGSLRGRVYSDGDQQIPRRALISSAVIAGNVLELHSRSFFHLQYRNATWAEEPSGDINATVPLDENLVLEEWNDATFLAYPPHELRITLKR